MVNYSLRHIAGRGAMWQVLAGSWQALVRLGASIILARILAPADFGLFGMALLAIELVNYLGGLGMTAGIIAKKEVGDKELSTCFWTMVGVRILLFCIAYLSAPLVALFMREPRVEAVVRVISFTFLISIFGIMGNTILSKKLEFGKISTIESIAILLESLLAVFLAKTTTLGYWSLVYPMLLANFISKISVFIAAKWYPKFLFDKESFKFQLRYGIHGLGFNITNYLHQNLDYLLVGRFLGSNSLGLYEYSYRIPHIVIDRIARPVGAVIFPALSKVQDNDESLIKGFVETVRYVTVITFPLLSGLAAIADPLVFILWGEKWMEVVAPLQILSLCAALRCCVQPIGAVFLCKNHPEIQFKQSIFSCMTTTIFVSIGVMFFDIIGVAIGMLLSTLSYSYSLILVFKITKKSIKLLYEPLAPQLISSIISALLTWIIINNTSVHNIHTLSLTIIAGAIFYIGSFYILFHKNFIEIASLGYKIIFNKNN